MNKKWIPTIILWAIGLVFFLPLYWLFASSLKSDLEITQFPPTFWPHTLEWSNYRKFGKR